MKLTYARAELERERWNAAEGLIAASDSLRLLERFGMDQSADRENVKRHANEYDRATRILRTVRWVGRS